MDEGRRLGGERGVAERDGRRGQPSLRCLATLVPGNQSSLEGSVTAAHPRQQALRRAKSRDAPSSSEKSRLLNEYRSRQPSLRPPICSPEGSDALSAMREKRVGSASEAASRDGRWRQGGKEGQLSE